MNITGYNDDNNKTMGEKDGQNMIKATPLISRRVYDTIFTAANKMNNFPHCLSMVSNCSFC